MSTGARLPDSAGANKRRPVTVEPPHLYLQQQADTAAFLDSCMRRAHALGEMCEQKRAMRIIESSAFVNDRDDMDSFLDSRTQNVQTMEKREASMPRVIDSSGSFAEEEEEEGEWDGHSLPRSPTPYPKNDTKTSGFEEETKIREPEEDQDRELCKPIIQLYEPTGDVNGHEPNGEEENPVIAQFRGEVDKYADLNKALRSEVELYGEYASRLGRLFTELMAYDEMLSGENDIGSEQEVPNGTVLVYEEHGANNQDDDSNDGLAPFNEKGVYAYNAGVIVQLQDSSARCPSHSPNKHTTVEQIGTFTIGDHVCETTDSTLFGKVFKTWSSYCDHCDTSLPEMIEPLIPVTVDMINAELNRHKADPNYTYADACDFIFMHDDSNRFRPLWLDALDEGNLPLFCACIMKTCVKHLRKMDLLDLPMLPGNPFMFVFNLVTDRVDLSSLEDVSIFECGRNNKDDLLDAVVELFRGEPPTGKLSQLVLD